MARGYLNQEKLTKESFIADPYQKGALMYKTGDKVRWTSEGEIEYLSRVDDQIKLRGYRIEPKEIETLIDKQAKVSQSVIALKEDSNKQKRLIGYLVTQKGFDKEKLTKELKSKLPEYMVPQIWVELESIPRTSNDKVDYKALPDPEIQSKEDQYVAPTNQTEQTLVNIWQELLKQDKIGIHDNFFELGGHSLLAMRVIAAIKKEFEVDLTLRNLFTTNSLVELSNLLIKSKTGSGISEIIPHKDPGFKKQLSYSQERLWFIDQFEGSVQYHLPKILNVEGELNSIALEKAIIKLTERHQVLKTVFKEERGEVYQEVLISKDFKLEEIDGTHLANDKDQLNLEIEKLIKKPFDLQKDLTIRVSKISFSKHKHLLVIVMHHIASDAWSVPIMVKEIKELYASLINHKKANLPSLKLQYSDFAIWQKSYLTDTVLAEKLEYWKGKLEGQLDLELPIDFSRPKLRSQNGSSTGIQIDKNTLDQLVQLSNSTGSTLYMNLLAGFSILLSKYSAQNDISVGASVASRPQVELENLIGFFVNTLTFRNIIDAEDNYLEFLGQVKKTVIDAYDHQDLPFEKIVEEVVKDRDPAISPLFQVMLVFGNIPESNKLEFGASKVKSQGFSTKISKFDLTLTRSREFKGFTHISRIFNRPIQTQHD